MELGSLGSRIREFRERQACVPRGWRTMVARRRKRHGYRESGRRSCSKINSGCGWYGTIDEFLARDAGCFAIGLLGADSRSQSAARRWADPTSGRSWPSTMRPCPHRMSITSPSLDGKTLASYLQSVPSVASSMEMSMSSEKRSIALNPFESEVPPLKRKRPELRR
jgi:hypothetical protein